MREIKFRVFDKAEHSYYNDNEDLRMSYFGPEYVISDDGFIQFQSPTGFGPIGDHNPERFSPMMQFTGLHDKNGKEIYEGDIISGKDRPKFKVEWHDGHFITVFEDGLNCVGLDQRLASAYEVIGNVWENPELISNSHDS